MVALATLILANESQRILAQWQDHKERQVQLYLAKANGLKLDKIIEQNDLQLQLLVRRTTDLDRLRATERERAIMRPAAPR